MNRCKKTLQNESNELKQLHDSKNTELVTSCSISCDLNLMKTLFLLDYQQRDFKDETAAVNTKSIHDTNRFARGTQSTLKV